MAEDAADSGAADDVLVAALVVAALALPEEDPLVALVGAAELVAAELSLAGALEGPEEEAAEEVAGTSDEDAAAEPNSSGGMSMFTSYAPQRVTANSLVTVATRLDISSWKEATKNINDRGM